MSKQKSPLLSLGARGTIGDALTYQKRGRDTIARKKPTPAYRFSLAQAYQRWLYEDYAYLWTQQSQATQRQYAADGVRFHLTGFQYWMKYQLTYLPDIAGWWKLDDNRGATTIDSSRNGNTGTIIGASPATGIIDKALDFDGINDYIDCGNSPSLAPTNAITIESFVKLTGDSSLTYNRFLGKEGYFSFERITPATAIITFILWDTFSLQHRSPWIDIGMNTWTHLVGTYDPSIDNGAVTLWVNGTKGPTTTISPSLRDSTSKSFLIAKGRGFICADIDNSIIYNRALNATEIKRHSERRYPL